jgi:hypothetical protein
MTPRDTAKRTSVDDNRDEEQSPKWRRVYKYIGKGSSYNKRNGNEIIIPLFGNIFSLIATYQESV